MLDDRESPAAVFDPFVAIQRSAARSPGLLDESWDALDRLAAALDNRREVAEERALSFERPRPPRSPPPASLMESTGTIPCPRDGPASGAEERFGSAAVAADADDTLAALRELVRLLGEVRHILARIEARQPLATFVEPTLLG
jgi:hypothetical protein